MYQEYILNKKVSIPHLKAVIKKIQMYGYIPIINLLAGLPFLNEKEQVEDTLTSIEWCIKHNTEIVLFPINIKPHTLVYYLYETGMYLPISQWQIIYILSIINESYLSKIDIAYWGNRDDSSVNEQVIFPLSCPKFHAHICNFYLDYLSTDNSKDRKKYINNLIEKTTCSCFQKFKSRLSHNNIDIKTRIKRAHTHLSREFGERI